MQLDWSKSHYRPAVALRTSARGDSRGGRPDRALRSFTLLEVILALGIATAILGVILFFYTQSEKLRNDLMREAARVTAARILLEKLTTELGTARRCEAFQKGLSGGADNLQFVKLDLPSASFWTNSLEATQGWPVTAYRLVTYSMSVSNIAGTNYTVDLATNEAVAIPAYDSGSLLTNVATVLGLTRTEESLTWRNLSPAPDLELAVTNAATARRTPPPTDQLPQLQYLRFRYWDGAAWQDSWSLLDLPVAVEVCVGADPLPPELKPEEYPGELFRRVIFLPLSTFNSSTNATATSATHSPEAPMSEATE